MITTLKIIQTKVIFLQEAPLYFDVQYYIRIYTILCISSIIFGLIIIFFLEAMCLVAARNLHDSMLKSIIQAPVR